MTKNYCYWAILPTIAGDADEAIFKRPGHVPACELQPVNISLPSNSCRGLFKVISSRYARTALTFVV
eukprot:2633381-Pleurochrysis_carterae.AAC.10